MGVGGETQSQGGGWLESHMGASNGHRRVPSVEIDAIMRTNAPENVRTCKMRKKCPDLPIEAVRQHSDGANGYYSNGRVYVHSIADNTEIVSLSQTLFVDENSCSSRRRTRKRLKTSQKTLERIEDLKFTEYAQNRVA